MANENPGTARRLRVGVVGCGEAAQILHLPTLVQLADRFAVTAVCDVSPTVLQQVGDLWGVEHRFTDHGPLVEHPEVDVVVVASPDPWHAQVALDALEAGKDVLVEKPMCLNLRECDELIAAAERTGGIVQVGYMRRHAPALAAAKRALEDLGEIRYARVHDIIGHNRLIIERTSRVIRGDDVPSEAIAATAARRTELVEEAIGPADATAATAYGTLLGLGSHDISAMRDLLGQPLGVTHATARRGGGYMTASIDYGDYVCQYETGVDDIPRFDAHIEVFGDRRIVRVQYDTPYVRNLPIRVTITDANDEGGVATQVLHPQWGDAFVAEWLAFHDCVTRREQPSASAEDFRRDLELFAEMMQLMSPAGDREPEVVGR